MLIEVQIMARNTGNWKYDIKGKVEIINTDYIKRITPYEMMGVFL